MRTDECVQREVPRLEYLEPASGFGHHPWTPNRWGSSQWRRRLQRRADRSSSLDRIWTISRFSSAQLRAGSDLRWALAGDLPAHARPRRTRERLNHADWRCSPDNRWPPKKARQVNKPRPQCLADLFAPWVLGEIPPCHQQCRIDCPKPPSSFRSGCQLPNSRQLRNYPSALRLLV